jgi:hypothetical protein
MRDDIDYAGFAANTKVPVERSRAEIDSLLVKNGASSIGILNDVENNRAAFAFTLRGAHYRVELPLPTREQMMPQTVGKEPQGWGGWTQERKNRYLDEKLDQARRQRWRCVLLMLKSKLEIVRMGFSSVEREFMADLVLPNGQTAYETFAEITRRGLSIGDLPKLLGTGK